MLDQDSITSRFDQRGIRVVLFPRRSLECRGCIGADAVAVNIGQRRELHDVDERNRCLTSPIGVPAADIASRPGSLPSVERRPAESLNPPTVTVVDNGSVHRERGVTDRRIGVAIT